MDRTHFKTTHIPLLDKEAAEAIVGDKDNKIKDTDGDKKINDI